MNVFIEALLGGIVGSVIGTVATWTTLEWRASQYCGEFENVIDIDRHRAG